MEVKKINSDKNGVLHHVIYDDDTTHIVAQVYATHLPVLGWTKAVIDCKFDRRGSLSVELAVKYMLVLDMAVKVAKEVDSEHGISS